MTKSQLRTILINAGVEMSNTVFKRTLLADLMAQVKSLPQDSLYKAEYNIGQELELAEENQEDATYLNEILCFISDLLNKDTKTPAKEEDVEIEIVTDIPNPVEPKEVIVEETPKAETKKAEFMYFQHIRTLAVYRWLKNITIGKTEVVVFVTPDKKEHKVTRTIAKTMYRKVSVAFVKQLMATTKDNKAVNNNPNKITHEVNCKLINGQRRWTVTGLKTGEIYNAREGRSVTNIFKSYEIEIKGLKAKVTFAPEDVKGKEPVAPF